MPWKFFDLIVQQFADTATFAVAYHAGRPVACGAGFVWGDEGEREFEITWASALREYNRMSPNMLVYWELMKHVSDAGVRTFNFGRCTPGGNTHRFKTQWGTRDQQLSWYDYSPRGAEPMTDASSVARIATTVWKYMPLPLANQLGPRLVRHIPL
jgi:lipid II:glycine glycyltransferase (peptidoglycan interpeptide bridge formation enzyme)